MADEPPLPDPEAYARGLSDQELRDYRTIYGETSREWVIAQRELDGRRYPSWRRYLYYGLLAFCLALLAFRFFD